MKIARKEHETNEVMLNLYEDLWNWIWPALRLEYTMHPIYGRPKRISKQREMQKSSHLYNLFMIRIGTGTHIWNGIAQNDDEMTRSRKRQLPMMWHVKRHPTKKKKKKKSNERKSRLVAIEWKLENLMKLNWNATTMKSCAQWMHRVRGTPYSMISVAAFEATNILVFKK